MINLTLDVIIKKEGAELEKAVIRAVKETRKVLFDAYSDGKVVPDEGIVSSTKRSNMTLQLAFCKYFKESNIQNIEISNQEFIATCLKINRLTPQELRKAEFSKIIPNFKDNQDRLSATFLREIARALGILLMSLWHQNVIILSPDFKMPITKKGRNGVSIHICDSFYSELLSFFQDLRTPSTNHIQRESLKSESSSLQNILSYAWRLIVSTDWHSVEDLCVKDIALFQKKMRECQAGNEKFVYMPLPVRSMLDLLTDRFDGRVRYTQASYIDAKLEVDGKTSKEATYSPAALSQGPWHSDVKGFELEQAAKEWARTQVAYVEGRKRAGMKSFVSYESSLTKLNEYLFFVLPQHLSCSDFKEDYPLAEPRYFTRKYLDGNDEIPSFIGHLQSGLSIDVSNAHLGRLEAYFDYLEALSTNSPA